MATESPPNPKPQPQTDSLILFSGPSSFQPQPPPPSPETPPAASQTRSFGLFSFQKRPSLRVTTEFDSDSSIFFHKVSSKLFNGIAKLKFSFQNNPKGEIADPQVAIITKHLALHYDVEDQNALVKGFLDVGPNLKLKASHDVKAKEGEVTLAANLSDPVYKIELSSTVPSIGLPKATFKFPCGEVSLEEKEDDEVKRVLSINGFVKGSILNGIGSAFYRDESLNLRYSYKDGEMSFIPSISLPSNAVSFAFKRRFSPSDKLSYWYNFDTNYWSTAYKHTVGEDYKFKAGYDSEVRLGWASLWVGNEGGKAKTAPMKTKVQFMLQVPQDDIKSSALMFRVKKRWDI
ncbi:outer envelope pore protein 37, chloroplastic-like [Amaranthus tricolor]|uniref:outer envelope pore protein 37, chloroplastic-like n=1 Tax=Amaranthus tricolor TaxID=29722 RepID=UPI00258E50C8|nr:outer envelope pore protein 37, chloroplastic-like [Amaranthus tricolor]